MIRVCSYNLATEIKCISYWFMGSDFFYVLRLLTCSDFHHFLSLFWCCTVQSWWEVDAWTPSPLTFICLFGGSQCRCSLQPLDHAAFGFLSQFVKSSTSTVCTGVMWQKPLSGGSVSRHFWEYLCFVTPLTFPSAPALCYQSFGPVLVLQVSTADCKRKLS